MKGLTIIDQSGSSHRAQFDLESDASQLQSAQTDRERRAREAADADLRLLIRSSQNASQYDAEAAGLTNLLVRLDASGWFANEAKGKANLGMKT